MSGYNYKLSTITKYRAGTIDDPYVNITESKQIINHVARLSEIPVERNRVVVPGYMELSVEMDSELEPTNFRVDYDEALVFFHSDAEGETPTFTYKGRGNHYVSASRVWTQEQDGEVIQTIQDILDTGNAALNNLNVLNEVVTEASEAIVAAQQALTNVETVESQISAAEDTRAAAEMLRIANETTRISNESLRDDSEDARSAAEIDRSDTEADRSAAESLRNSSEVARATNETTRISTEAIRVLDETTRSTNEATRQSQEAMRQSEESSRISAESNRETVEAARNSAETIRTNNEVARQSNESARTTSEASRDSTETNRAAAESTRNTNELLRQSKESTRINAESTRVADEVSRATAESNREAQESSRALEEENRADTEDLRTAAEAARVTSEASRVTEESTRVSKELLRAAAETSSASAESVRATNEASRASAETSRTNAEATRTSHETGRVTSENIRETQEADRQSNTADAILILNNTNDAFKVFEEYNHSTTYSPLNKVAYNGSSYICLVESTGNLPTSESYWLMIAARGVDGEGTGSVIEVKSTSGDITITNASITPDLTLSLTGVAANTYTSVTVDNKGRVTSGSNPSTLANHISDDDIHVTAAEKITWTSKQAALGFIPENVANKGIANGYATLDANGKLIQAVEWTNLANKPTSTVADIDQTVTDRHTHANQSIIDGTQQSFTTILKSKLDGVATGAEVNQNAFSTVIVAGQANIEADAKSDALTLAAGAGLTITTNATTDTVTVTPVLASTAVAGIVQLSTSTSSTSTTLGATSSAVKSAYDLANQAIPASGGVVTGLLDFNTNTNARLVLPVGANKWAT